MKKEYVTPKLHSFKLDCSSLLCNSLTLNIDEGTEISDENSIWSNSESEHSSIWD